MSPFIRRIGIGVPEGWYAKESITVMDPGGRANVIVSSEPLDPGIDVERYMATQGALLHAEFEGYHEESLEPALVFGGRSGYIRRFGWSPPDGVPVRQIQVYAVEESRGFTATATTPLTSSEEFERTFAEVIDTLQIATVADDWTDDIH